MASMLSQLDPVSRVVVGGVDTHKDLHVAAVVDTGAVVLGTESFSTTRAGDRAMVRWMGSFGDLGKVGVAGTGSTARRHHPAPDRGRDRGPGGRPARPQ